MIRAMGKPFYQLWFLMLALLVFLTGCGGGGNGSSVTRSSSMQFSLEWPNRTRLVPKGANSVIVTVSYKGKEVDRATLNRPQAADIASTENHLFEKLPAGRVSVTVTAYPELEGRGTPLAKGVSTVTLVENATTPQAATMVSTAATLELTADATSFAQGSNATLTLTAKDTNGALVLLQTDQGGDSVTWTSDSEIATVDGDDQTVTVHGRLAGTANIKAEFVVDDSGTKIEKSIGLTITASETTSVKFKMPWTFKDGTPALAPWKSVKATVLSGSHVIDAKTITRSGTSGEVELEGLAVGGSYTLKYEINGRIGSAITVVSQASVTITAQAGPVAEYTFGTAPFAKAPVYLYPESSAMNSNGAIDLGIGSFAGIFTTVVYSDGSTEELSDAVFWSSSDPAVAKRESANVFKGLSVGTAYVTATYGGIPMSLYVNVY